MIRRTAKCRSTVLAFYYKSDFAAETFNATTSEDVQENYQSTQLSLAEKINGINS